MFRFVGAYDDGCGSVEDCYDPYCDSCKKLISDQEIKVMVRNSNTDDEKRN